MSEENFEQNDSQVEQNTNQTQVPKGLPPHLPPNLKNKKQNAEPQPVSKPEPQDVEPEPVEPEPQQSVEPEQPKKKKNKKEKEVVDKQGRVIVKKKGGCGTFFAGFVFAFIFLIFTIGGAGAYVYFCVNLQQVESLIGVKLPIEGDLNKKTIKDLIALGLDLKDSYVHIKIGELDTKVGIKLPEKFPGTDIGIDFLYEDSTTVKFKGNDVKFLDIEVMDAINNMNSLFDGVLDVVFDHVTVGEILKTANLEQTIEDMGWPALVSPIYTVSGTNKKLADLTINQAKDVLVDYYGADNLTVQKLVEATDLMVIPNKPMYDTLRALKVQKMTTQDLLDNITGEILNDLVDLSDFEFTQTEEFNNTALSGMIDYIESLPLGDFITFENCVDDDYFTNHPTFESLKKTYVSKLNDGILNLKINQILTPTQIARTTLSASQIVLTLPQLLQTNPTQTILMLFGAQNVEEVGAYVKELQLTTTANFQTEFNNLSWAEKLGIDGSTALLELSTLSLGDVAESDDIPETIFSKLGTLGDLIGSTDSSIMQLISKVKLTDLLTNAGDAIMDALKYDDAHNQVDLATLLGMTSTDGINGIVSNIKVKALLETPNDAISDALKGSTSTLGQLLEMSSSATGINKIIKDITVGALFNTPDTTIKNAMEESDVTLKELLGISDENNTGINAIISGITVGTLFSDQKAIETTLKSSETTLAVLLGMASSDGINGIVGGIKVKDLFTSPDTVIKSELQANTQTLKDFLGATTTPNSIADYVLTELTVADLFDDDNIAETLTTKINNMPLRFVLGTQPETGFLALIDSNYYANATVGGIQTLVESVDVANITLGTLIDKQVITLDYGVFSDPNIVNGMRTLTLMDILEAYYVAVRDGHITP